MSSKRGMYWYKPWCELRTRILLGTGGIAALCLLAVWMQTSYRRPSYAGFMWALLYHSVLRDIFIVLTIVFASGSLLQERPQGAVGFTLALPVTRRYASLMRAIVGYLGVVAMALVPALVLPVTSPLVGEHFALSAALRFTLLYACGGSVIYGLTFLLAHLMEGEYSAFLLALPTIIVYDLLLDIPGLHRFPPLDFISVMTGAEISSFDPHAVMFRNGLPWLAMSVMLAVGVIFVWLAVSRVAERDFA